VIQNDEIPPRQHVSGLESIPIFPPTPAASSPVVSCLSFAAIILTLTAEISDVAPMIQHCCCCWRACLLRPPMMEPPAVPVDTLEICE